jgi:hypothetical protein
VAAAAEPGEHVAVGVPGQEELGDQCDERVQPVRRRPVRLGREQHLRDTEALDAVQQGQPPPEAAGAGGAPHDLDVGERASGHRALDRHLLADGHALPGQRSQGRLPVVDEVEHRLQRAERSGPLGDHAGEVRGFDQVGGVQEGGQGIGHRTPSSSAGRSRRT